MVCFLAHVCVGARFLALKANVELSNVSLEHLKYLASCTMGDTMVTCIVVLSTQL